MEENGLQGATVSRLTELVDVLGLMVSGRLVYGGILRKKRWGYNGVQSW